jgi:hypothetical protein
VKKGGRGGFIFSTSPPSPPLPDKASPSPLPFLPLLAGFENPPRPPLVKGGDIRGFLWPIVKSPRPPLQKGGEIFWPLRKEGDIPRLFSDRMPQRIACRQVSENSRTFPPPLKKGGRGGFPMKKGGRGGFIFSTSPPSPPLPDKASPSPLPFLPLLPGC